MPPSLLARLLGRRAAAPDTAPLLEQARRAIGAGNSAAALGPLREATTARPDDAEAWALLGYAAFDSGDTKAARAALDRALALAPDHVEALNTRGVMAADDADPGESITWFERALAADPDNAATRYNLAQRLLFAGRYARGFALMAARHVALGGVANPLAPLPAWQGEALDGRRAFVWCDWGGLGDHLQFVRYISLLREQARPAYLTLGCQTSCARLFAGIEGVEAVVAPGTVPPVDVHVPLLDIPWRLGTDETGVPWRGPYLRADAGLAARWGERLRAAAPPSAAPRPRVGLVWASGQWNQGAAYDRVRLAKSVPVAALASLADLPVQWVSLQKDVRDRPALPMIDLADHITDFADTAALIASLDVVVSVDTAVAHLAGALGKPVLLLLRHAGGMFWSLAPETSPWYPTLKILRQRVEGRWDEPLAALQAKLSATGTP